MGKCTHLPVVFSRTKDHGEWSTVAHATQNHTRVSPTPAPSTKSTPSTTPPPTPSPKQQQQHDGHRPEREAPADFLANRDMSRNGLGFAVSLRQEPPRLVDLEGANGLPE